MQLVPWALKDARQLESKVFDLSLGPQISQPVARFALRDLLSQDTKPSPQSSCAPVGCVLHALCAAAGHHGAM